MDIEYLRTFCTTVELGSMARAAAALGISQPAVSHEIRTLESHLGVKLLDRTPEGAVPTEYGVIAYEGYSQILRLCSQVHERVVQRRARGRTVLSVGASAFPGGYVVPFAMRPFAVRHPDVGIDLKVRPVPELLDLLHEGHLDFAILDGRVDHPDLALQFLAADPALVVAGPGVEEAERELTLEEWLDAPHVLCAESCTALSLFAFVASHRLDAGRLRVAATVESLEAAKALVVAGLGLGAFPARSVREEIQAEALHVVTVRGWNLRVPVAEVHLRRRPLSPPAQAFVEQVRTLLRPGQRMVPAV